jgi:fermentation-respiration switch protein FrsA (DUF1100 family)
MVFSVTIASVAVLGAALFLTHPAHVAVGSPPPELWAEAVAIPSPSGTLLRGWLVTGRAGGGAVVLMHGIRSNRLSMVRRAKLLNDAGFSALLFDFQAHGESTGQHMSFGALEALDARAAVAFLRERLPAERIGAIGSSLGGAAILLGPGPLQVDALVIEAVYPDIGAALENRVHIFVGPFARPISYLLEHLLTPLTGVRPAELRPIDHIGAVVAPIFVASGTLDNRTTIAEARTLFERAPEPKLFWAVEGARHIDLEAFAPVEYRQRVLPFLLERLQR